MNLEQFHFLRPYCLLAFLPLVILLWLMLKRKLGSHNWEAVCDEALLPHILIGNKKSSRKGWPIFLIALCGSLAIVALAGPVWSQLPQPVFTQQSALVIALDLSRSMDADDIKPSRVARARFKIADILKQRAEGQTALLIYAGDAFTVTPLTDDTATIISQLNALSTGIMPVQGNRTDLALKHAKELLRQGGVSRGDILLITDEVDLERSQDKAQELVATGYRVSILGIGTEYGVPVPLHDGSFLKDRKGQIVIPVLEEAPMQQLAALGGGQYVRMQVNDGDIERLDSFFNTTNTEDDIATSELKTDVWREQGPWLLILLIPLAALGFRRGYMLILLGLFLPFPEQAQAVEWKDLWSRPDQQAAEAFNNGDYEGAAKLFNDPAWKGIAKYKAKDYAGAAQTLEEIEDAESLYNKGNALAQTGQYEQAISAYEKVLEQMPGHEDAQYNKKIVEEELKKQQEQQQQQQQQQQEGDQNQEQQNKEKQDGEEQENQGQNSESEQPESEQQQSSDQQQSEQQQDPDNNSEMKQSEKSDSEQKEDEQQQQQAAQEEEQKEGEQEQQSMTSSDEQPDEEEQASEQWLRRIPDDPAGLLRRKFKYQYQQRGQNQDSEEKTW